MPVHGAGMWHVGQKPESTVDMRGQFRSASTAVAGLELPRSPAPCRVKPAHHFRRIDGRIVDRQKFFFAHCQTISARQSSSLSSAAQPTEVSFKAADKTETQLTAAGRFRPGGRCDAGLIPHCSSRGFGLSGNQEREQFPAAS